MLKKNIVIMGVIIGQIFIIISNIFIRYIIYFPIQLLCLPKFIIKLLLVLVSSTVDMYVMMSSFIKMYNLNAIVSRFG